MNFKQKVDDFVNPSDKVVIFAGAGISANSPSNLPTAITFMNELFNNLQIDNDYKNHLKKILYYDSIKSGKVSNYLRFEMLIGVIQLLVDENLNILEIYAKCEYPNSYHYFLAQKLSEGAIILSTNFDNLIELACIEKGIKYNLIVTKEDFINFLNNPAIYSNLIIKLHGGFNIVRDIENIVNGAVNVATTIFQVGRLSPDNIINSYLVDTLTLIFSERKALFIGYSGSDDFDIIPILENIMIKHGILWINHNENKESEKTIHFNGSTFDDEEMQNKLSTKQHYRLFKNIISKNNTSNLISVECNTMQALNIENVVDKNISYYNWNIELSKWIKKFLNKPYLVNHLIADIFVMSGLINKSKVLYNEVLENHEKHLDAHNQKLLKFKFARCKYISGEYSDVINILSQFLDLPDDQDNILIKAYSFLDIGRIYSDIGKLNEAFRFLSNAQDIFIKAKNSRGLSEAMHGLGRVMNDLGMYEGAIEYLEKSIELAQKFGDISGTGMTFYGLGQTYHEMGKFEAAENYMLKALNIFSKIFNQDGLATVWHGLGKLAESLNNYSRAEECYQYAIHWGHNGGHKINLAHSLNNLGMIYKRKGDYKLAEETLLEALKIKQKINDIRGIGITNANLGGIYLEVSRISDALQCFETAKNNFQEIDEKELIEQMNQLIFVIKTTRSD